MSQIVVTLTYLENQNIDLALPNDIACELLGNAVAQALRLSADFPYYLSIERGMQSRNIHPKETLSAAGVMFGDNLRLLSEENYENSLTKVNAFFRFGDEFIFRLRDTMTVLGRSTPMKSVDIDLTIIDNKKVISRQHAAVEIINNNYYLVDFGSLHGTILNNERMRPNQQYSITNQDLIQLGGEYGVRLTFIVESEA